LTPVSAVRPPALRAHAHSFEISAAAIGARPRGIVVRRLH